MNILANQAMSDFTLTTESTVEVAPAKLLCMAHGFEQYKMTCVKNVESTGLFLLSFKWLTSQGSGLSLGINGCNCLTPG